MNLDTEPAPSTTLAYEVLPSGESSLAVMLGIVGLRLLAVYYLVAGASSVPIVVYYVTENSSLMRRFSWLTYAGAPAVYLVASVCLFALAPKVSTRLFARLPAYSMHVSAEMILTLFIAVIGLWAIINSLGAVVTTCVALLSKNFRGGLSMSPGASANVMDFQMMMLLATFAQPAAGVFLLLRARWLARIGMSRLNF